MVPPSDIGECYLNSEICLDQLRQLFQAVAKASFRIVRIGGGRVVRGIGGFQRFDRVEGVLAGAVQDAGDRVVVHGLEGARHWRSVGIFSPDGKIVDVVDGSRGFFAGENARQRWAQGDRSEG